MPGVRYVGIVTWWGATGAGEGVVNKVPERTGKKQNKTIGKRVPTRIGKRQGGGGEVPPRRRSPADMAIVVPATIPMAMPLWRGVGMGGAYMAAGIPLGCTTVVWWMTCGGAAYSGCV